MAFSKLKIDFPAFFGEFFSEDFVWKKISQRVFPFDEFGFAAFHFPWFHLFFFAFFVLEIVFLEF